MVTVTDRAAQLLKDLQESQEERGDKILRLVHNGDHFELGLDDRRDDDQILQSGETDVLLVATDVSELLGDATIDCTDTPAGPRLTLTAPGEPPA
jgi:Fe-S cluster assembly iron-binding protein IscA